MKNFFNEFKDFITKVNLMEVAAGILLATGFKDLITSFSNTFILPVINRALNFAPKASENSAVNVGGIQINYGAFVTELISFVITGVVLFLMIKLSNRISRNSKKAPAQTEVSILLEIRDLLKKK